MRRPIRLACLVALASSVCVPHIAAACSFEPPPAPPPRTAAESEAAFAERTRSWYADINERQRQEELPGMAAHEERLWRGAQRVVLARVERVGSIRLRGSEGQRYESPLVTLRPTRWVKGHSSARRLQVHFLSDDSCAFGGAGDATEGEVGDVFLLFYRSGSVEPREVLDTFDRHRVVTQRSRRAFDVDGGR